MYIVVCLLEAKLGKELELEAALKKVAALSSVENACIEYRVHKSKNNPKQYILYEIWENQEKHQAQFEKLYIQDLASNLERLLGKTYEAYFGADGIKAFKKAKDTGIIDISQHVALAATFPVAPMTTQFLKVGEKANQKKRIRKSEIDQLLEDAEIFLKRNTKKVT